MISTFGECYKLCLYSRSAKIYIMSLLSPIEIIEIIKTLLPGLIALTSILVVIIVFLLERYTNADYELDKETYRSLTWRMTFALIIGVADIILSLPMLLGFEQAFLVYFAIVLILFCICLLLVCTGTFKAVREILKRE